jgi:hypothetical protein
MCIKFRTPIDQKIKILTRLTIYEFRRGLTILLRFLYSSFISLCNPKSEITTNDVVQILLDVLNDRIWSFLNLHALWNCKRPYPRYNASRYLLDVCTLGWSPHRSAELQDELLAAALALWLRGMGIEEKQSSRDFPKKEVLKWIRGSEERRLLTRRSGSCSDTRGATSSMPISVSASETRQGIG